MTSEESSALSEVFTKLPGRRKQCRILLDFFTTDGYLPPNIYIHGNSATGKTITVASLLEHLGISNVQLSCVEFDTPALLSSQVATKFREYVEGSNQSNCSNLMDLVEVMQTADFKDPFIIVLDRAERLREMPSTVIPALLKLQELSGMNVCVVLVSDLPWERFYHGKMRFCKPAFDLFFPQYSKSECIEIIREKRPEEVDDALYFSYVSILLRVLYRFCRDLNELLYMADQHFVLVKDLNNDQRTIWTTLQPHLKAATQRVHLRQGLQPVDVKSSNALISAVTAMELPYYAKFLLMAAFLASFNSPKHDRRLFAKHHGMQRKKAVVQKKTVKRSSLIVGPKPFNFERLTAIFHSIADTPYLITTNLCAQLATLVNLQLITKVGFSGLNDPKYKCAVGFEFIKAVGRTVDFNVQSYIMEEY
ncbi:origin recognition complex subunit 5 [Neocloeon triangulifer]|uniref:origin recognition complex subunit 5 n=1 Tax=Neocloeon triangulifer TaxID=2078957 RepID=UPI00286EC2B5|nr:origin recognition complex subunit 5 [Neocloeon triangulifer]